MFTPPPLKLNYEPLGPLHNTTMFIIIITTMIMIILLILIPLFCSLSTQNVTSPLPQAARA